MFGRIQNWIAMALSLGVLVSAGFAADEKEASEANEEAKHPFSVKLVDEDGKPVEGATAGVSAYFGNKRLTPWPTDDGGWRYGWGGTSNADGIVDIEDARFANRQCVVARDTQRKLIAIWKVDLQKLDPEKSSEMVVITMHPECRITGQFACNDLAERGRAIGWTNVYFMSEGARAFGCQSDEQKFHFFAPPGDYVLNLYGSNLNYLKKQISVRAGQHDLDLGTIDVPATQLALLEGLPAPEIKGVECWKNGPGVRLEDLKGKCVILDFWGFWCGPCIYSMPELFKLHDKHHDDGLEIIGIHVDVGEDKDDLVNTVEKLDAKLSKIREELWGGRDVPYPVGLIHRHRDPDNTAIESPRVRAEILTEYGIPGFPTLVLINRQGNVVCPFHPQSPEHVALLEKLLNDK